MTATRRIEDVVRAVAGIGAAANEGAVIDLAGLEDAVANVLQAAREAPTGERPAVRAGLADLIAALDLLTNALKRQQHASLQRRAVAAYGRAAAPGTPPAPEDEP